LGARGELVAGRGRGAVLAGQRDRGSLADLLTGRGATAGLLAAARLVVSGLVTLRGLGGRRLLPGLGALSRLPNLASGRLLLALDLLDDRLAVGDPRLGLRIGVGPLGLDEALVVAERGSEALTHGRVRSRLGGRRLRGVRGVRHDEGTATRHRGRAQQQRELLLRAESSPTRHARLLKR